ncbi:MAG: energy-coupling factor transporter ATPase [Coriobacteriia bacterium]|nr:energy-coupling factor transporter ATPase [Coriobacteriia bacterium]
MIRFENIAYSYDAQGGAPALRGVSLEVHPGDMVAVLGSNGSGKSTLARMANGLFLPDSGTVTVDGIDTRDTQRVRELRERVGMVFQRPDDQIVATSVEDEVAFGPENLGLAREHLRSRVDEALAAVGLTGLERREPHLLSGGQKQRLAIAGALAMRPAYLIVDEPTSMLDPQGRTEVLGIFAQLRKEGHGFLHVTHNLADVFDADRVVVLLKGSVRFAGTMREVLAEPGLLAECGLEMPPFLRFAEELRRLGVPVPRDVADAEKLVMSLWP